MDISSSSERARARFAVNARCVALLAAVVGCWCAAPAEVWGQAAWAECLEARSPERVIGLLLPPDAAEHDAILRGVRAAVERAQPPVRLAVRGRRGHWGSDAVEAARLITDDGAEALIGPTEPGTAHLLLQVARKTRKPVVLLCPQGSVTRSTPQRVLRIAPSMADEVRVLLDALPESVAGAATCWGLLLPAGREGRGVAADVEAVLAASGRPHVVLARVPDEVPSVETLRARLAANPCHGILLALPPRASGRAARRLRESGYAGLLAGPGWLVGPAFAAASGSACEDLVVCAPATLLDASRGGDNSLRVAGPGLSAAFAEDAVRLLLASFRQGDSFPPETSVPGVTGLLAFDGSGNRICRIGLARIREGHAVSWIPRAGEKESALPGVRFSEVRDR